MVERHQGIMASWHHGIEAGRGPEEKGDLLAEALLFALMP